MTFDACDSVRFRRCYLASEIDQECRRLDGKARIASIACGHLREAIFSLEVAARNFDVLFALDSDEKALDHVQETLDEDKIKIINEDIRSIITRKSEIGAVDFIYSAGLYDYLNSKMAKRLSSRLFELLRPGGRLTFANFLPTIRARGYMQAFMDWHLVYRTPEDIGDLLSEIDPHSIERREFFIDPLKSVFYVSVYRKSA